MNEPVKCIDCGVWWRGPEHRCPPVVATTGVVTVWPGAIGSGHTTSAPYCGICKGWHIPGQGGCTGTWSGS